MQRLIKAGKSFDAKRYNDEIAEYNDEISKLEDEIVELEIQMEPWHAILNLKPCEDTAKSPDPKPPSPPEPKATTTTTAVPRR